MPPPQSGEKALQPLEHFSKLASKIWRNGKTSLQCLEPPAPLPLPCRPSALRQRVASIGLNAGSSEGRMGVVKGTDEMNRQELTELLAQPEGERLERTRAFERADKIG